VYYPGRERKNVPFIVFRARKSECKGIPAKKFSLLDVYSIIDVHASSIECSISREIFSSFVDEKKNNCEKENSKRNAFWW
jgi:hypothetical protein